MKRDFDNEHSARFWKHKTRRHGRVHLYDFFGHKRVNEDDDFHDGLDKSLGSSKIKFLVF